MSQPAGFAQRRLRASYREAFRPKVDWEAECARNGDSWLRKNGYLPVRIQKAGAALPRSKQRRVILDRRGEPVEELKPGYSLHDPARAWYDLAVGVGWSLLLGEAYGADAATRSEQAHDLVRREATEVYLAAQLREAQEPDPPLDGVPDVSVQPTEASEGKVRVRLSRRKVIRLTAEAHDQLEAQARNHGKSVAAYARQLLREGLALDNSLSSEPVRLAANED